MQVSCLITNTPVEAQRKKPTFKVGANRPLGGASSVKADTAELVVHPPLVQAERTS